MSSNELLFGCHILVILAVCFTTARLGKTALTTLTALLAVLANFFVLKQTVLFGLNVTCSDVYIIGSTLSLNLLQEVYGARSAKKAIGIAFVSMILFGVLSQFQLLYVPSQFDTAHSSYLSLLAVAPRIVVASFAAYFVSQLCDLSLFRWLKSGSFAWRSTIAMLLCQLIDTIVFAWAGLAGLVASVWQIVAMSFVIKMFIILTAAPLTYLAGRLLPKKVAE